MDLKQPAKLNIEFADEFPGITYRRGMTFRVKEKFRRLEEALDSAMISDWTSPRDREIYGHMISHVNHLHKMYAEILADER